MEEKNAEKKEAAGLMDHLFFLFVINDPIDLALFFFPLLCERALALPRRSRGRIFCAGRFSPLRGIAVKERGAWALDENCSSLCFSWFALGKGRSMPKEKKGQRCTFRTCPASATLIFPLSTLGGW